MLRCHTLFSSGDLSFSRGTCKHWYLEHHFARQSHDPHTGAEHNAQIAFHRRWSSMRSFHATTRTSNRVIPIPTSDGTNLAPTPMFDLRTGITPGVDDKCWIEPPPEYSPPAACSKADDKLETETNVAQSLERKDRPLDSSAVYAAVAATIARHWTICLQEALIQRPNSATSNARHSTSQCT